MEKYLEKNFEYWQRGYFADNVESFVFRPYGRILKQQFSIDGSKQEKLLDFGCGQGAALSFFYSKGFDVYGVDISTVDIEQCRKRMPEIHNHFVVIDPKPNDSDVFFEGNYDVIIAIQSLYYYNNKDLQTRLTSLYKQLKKGGIIYATMMGTQCWYYNHSVEY
ncbi:class I SAM-dependent methyltransferase [Heliorestis acidaminivorans]|uniref:Class I SAM-dependent methyltransferase n=1 Tax=Heliorestis acidaminivorans TaxID=553427 RepID=A0A6I0F3D1_9FIRM|nr:class I SAM-dependent methyltransferase [Heliorestis acidaminivorans]KAB2952941.1 class I SAM-dependent methyltransferase [Heliorestis acidaminivorans]